MELVGSNEKLVKSMMDKQSQIYILLMLLNQLFSYFIRIHQLMKMKSDLAVYTEHDRIYVTLVLLVID